MKHLCTPSPSMGEGWGEGEKVGAAHPTPLSQLSLMCRMDEWRETHGCVIAAHKGREDYSENFAVFIA